MEIAKIKVSGATASAEKESKITAGMVGVTVRMQYADIWDGLHKTVVFRAGTVTKDVITDDEVVKVPKEVVAAKDVQLYVGVYGVDAEGNLVIPTIWAGLGTVRDGADPSGDAETDASLPAWVKIMTDAETAVAVAQSVRDDADRGAFDGKPGKPGNHGITPTVGENGNWYIGDTDTGKPSRGETGPQGEPGPAGPKGEKGDTGSPATLVTKSVTYQVSDSGTIIPSGSWVTDIPVVAQGKYLWTKTELKFNSGDPIVSYSVARMGIDGTGSVSSVAGVSPDATGNVTLTPADVGALAVSGGYMEGEISMNGQPISGLNDPTEDTQAARKGYVDASVRKAATRNLLDNSDFRNPVNQREQTSYSGNVYSIDRWELGFWSSDGSGKANLSVESDGIRLFGGTSSASIPNSCDITQKLDASEMLGKIYTIAVSVTSLSGAGRGRILVGYDNTFVSKDNIKIGINILTFAMPSSASTFFVEIGNEASESGVGAIDALIEWAALYEGYYTAETLPEYKPKGYGAELAECQRYYQIRSANNIAAVDMRPTMRLSIPTITSVSGGYAYSADL